MSEEFVALSTLIDWVTQNGLGVNPSNQRFIAVFHIMSKA